METIGMVGLVLGASCFFGLLNNERQGTRPNARFASRALAAMPLVAVACLILWNSLAVFGRHDGDFVDPSVEWAGLGVFAGFIATPWPIAAALLPFRAENNAPIGRLTGLKVLLAVILLTIYMFAWGNVVAAPCRGGCGPVEISAVVLGTLGMPVLAIAGLAPAAALLGEGLVAWHKRQRQKMAAAMATEVRNLYANGRLKRGEFEGFEQLLSDSFGPRSDVQRKERRGGFFLAESGFIVIGGFLLSTIRFASKEPTGFDRLPIDLGASTLILLAAIASALVGANALSVSRIEAAQHMERLQAMHLQLVHKAGRQRVAVRGKVALDVQSGIPYGNCQGDAGCVH